MKETIREYAELIRRNKGILVPLWVIAFFIGLFISIMAHILIR